MVFELSFDDGSKQVALPVVNNTETGIRFTNFYRTIATAHTELYRDVLIKRFAENQVKRYPDVKNIRAVFGIIQTQLRLTVLQ